MRYSGTHYALKMWYTMSEKIPAIKFVFDRRKTATEIKPSSVELEIYFDRAHRKRVSTGVKLCLGQWDEKLHAVNCFDGTAINAHLAKLKQKQEEIFSEMYAEGIAPSYENYEAYVGGEQQKQVPVSFPDYMEQRIEERGLREGTKKAHRVALEALRRFGRIRTFASLTPANLYAFDIFLRKEDPTRKQTTIHGYHKRIKVYVNEAFRLEYIEKNPYDHFVDKRGTPKERNPLTSEELSALMDLRLTGKLEKARDLFIFCTFTGLAYGDMSLFKYNRHVVTKNGRQYIDTSRMKTGTAYFTPLLKPARDVLEKYGYELPCISNQKLNDFLHVIEARLDLKKPLTSHLARHTFATTVCLSNGIPIETVSRMLGHRHITTTEIYAKILKDKVEKGAEKLEAIYRGK